MAVRFIPHALERADERGASRSEIIATIEHGDGFPAKHSRSGFRRNFPGTWLWRGRSFDTKQLEVYAVREGDDWLAITVIVKFF